MLKRRIGLIFLALVTVTSSAAYARLKTTSPPNIPSNSQPSVEATNPPNLPSDSQPSVEATSPPNIPSNSQPSVEATSPPNVPSNSQPSVDSKNEVSMNLTYFSTWIIKRYVPTVGVQGFSKKNAKDYLGGKIIVDENQIITSEGTIKKPKFIKKTLTNTDFYNKWNINFSNAGITGITVTEIDVSNFNIRNGTEDRIGSNFVLTNNNKIYTFIGGALFELGK